MSGQFLVQFFCSGLQASEEVGVLHDVSSWDEPCVLRACNMVDDAVEPGCQDEGKNLVVGLEQRDGPVVPNVFPRLLFVQ